MKVLHLLLIALLGCLSVARGDITATFTSASDVAVTSNGYTAAGTATLSLGFAPVAGTELTVVKNTGIAFISGTFSNLVQGQSVSLSYGGVSYGFGVNYYGGSGNDLVLVWKNSRIVGWGTNNFGQLGQNSGVNTSLPVVVPVAVYPTGVLAGKTMKSIVAGSSHSVSLCADGTVAAWGSGNHGELGNNSTTGSIVPVAVTVTGVLAGKTVVAIAAGSLHSMALCSDGTVATWGYNLNGQLGNNSTTQSNVPVAVTATGVLAGRTVVAIAAGNAHCMVLCSDGTLATWGYNASGQLGNNSTTSSSVPVAVDTTGVLAGKTVVAIAAGSLHSFALCSDGTLVAWGYNLNGQLGNNSTTQSNVPVAVTATGVLADRTVVAIAAGLSHSVVLCSDGTLAACGSNNYGQLGNNSATDSAVPVLVDKTGVLAGKTVLTIVAGNYHSTVLCSDGTLATWGRNNYGQLGNNSTTNSNVPVAVNSTVLTAGERFSKISGGGPTAPCSLALASAPTLTVTTPTSTGVTASTATLGGNVTSDGGAAITERGVVFSVTATNNDPTNGGTGVTKVTTSGTTGVFTVAVTGLSGAATYSFKAYATNNLGTSYTSVGTFITLMGAPTTTTPTSANVTASSVTLGGDVISDGGATITERGIVYSATATNTNPTIGGIGVTKMTTSGTTGVFTIPVSGLSTSTGYSFKAYATNSLGTAYTSVGTFSTLALPPVVTTPTSASVTASTATLGGHVTSDGSGAISERGVVYAATAINNNPIIGGTGVTKATSSGTTGVFTVLVSGLSTVTGYSFKAYATNSAGTTYTSVGTFTTLSAPPMVTTPTSTGVTASTATLGGNVTSDGGVVITERGVVYSATITNNNPTIGGTGVTKVMASGTTGVFTSAVTGLSVGASYSFKAYATNSVGTNYTSVGTFTTLAPPTVTTPTSAGLTASTATLGGHVTSDGGALITERGVVYSVTTTNNDPTIGGTGVTKVTSSGTTGVFTIPVSGLSAITDYSFKAYATNSLGTIYTSVGTFTTLALPPVVTTPTSTDVTASMATLGGHVTSDGGAAITERGIVFSATATNNNPIIGGTGATKVTTSGTTGVYTVPVSDLSANRGYSFKAYATNSAGTTYTSVGTFTTLSAPPMVTTPTSTGVTASTATLGGNVTSDGGLVITERGVVYSATITNNNPTIGGTGVTKVMASGTTGVFTSAVTGLSAGTSYSFKAYATNSVGTTYTSVGTFTTLAPPTVTTPTTTGVTASTATLGGHVTSDGGALITERGVIYSATATNNDPIIGGTGVTKVTSSGTTGVFTIPVSGLSAITDYSFKAYATNSLGTIYTSVGTFTTLAAPPTVMTPTSTGVTASTATLGGNVTSVGSAVITERGVVYSATATNNDPTIAGIGVTKVTTTGTTGVFTVPVSGLGGNTGYSFKAYATNAVGTAYTSASTFTTLVGSITATFTTATDVPVTLPAATLTGGTATLSLGFAPVAGTELMVVKNTGVAFISGVFSNLVQGQSLSLSYGGVTYGFVVNYYGGSGNDLVLVWKNSRALAWGANGFGRLGNNSTTNSSVPVAVDATGFLLGKTVVAVAAGYDHSLALRSDGKVAAWGRNSSGQLGSNSTAASSVPVAVSATGPLAGKIVVAVAAGEYHSLALCSDGTVAAWGRNDLGQLGNNSTANSLVPVAVESTGVLAGKTVVAIAAGMYHSMVLCSDGTVVAWGYGGWGQLGNGSTFYQVVPVAVNTAGVLAGKTVVAIAAGQDHSMALSSDGTVASWGYNFHGQLGNPSTTQNSSVPVAVDATGVLAGKTVVAIAAGSEHSLGLCSDGTVAAWGYNGSGQLGNNSTTQSLVPVAVDAAGVLAGKAVAAITAGFSHSAALCSDGTVAAWGGNGSGQLGSNSTTSSSVPVAVNSTVLAAGERFSKLSAAGSMADHSLALASALPLIVTNPTSTSVTAATATLGGDVSSDGGAVITERGVVYSATAANSNPTIGGSGVTKVTTSGTTGVFTVPATGLAAGTGYSFKAYATNATGTSYTSVGTFTTLAPPTITSPTSTGVTAFTATMGGQVTSDGGTEITERGVVYSTTATNNDPIIGGTGVMKVTTSGTTGVFTVPVSGLSAYTGYSFKAYAINAVGTTYTSVRIFNTFTVNGSLYFTDFESFPGGSNQLAGTDGWLASNTTDGVAGIAGTSNKEAYVGYNSTAESDVFAWRPINYDPVAAGTPVMEFDVNLSVIDSTNGSYDSFSFQLYNEATELICSLEFDNANLNINRWDGSASSYQVGTFANDAWYALKLTFDFAANRWSARLGNTSLFVNQPMNTQGTARSLGDIAVYWHIRNSGTSGDNYLMFDDYRIAVPGNTEPPTITMPTSTGLTASTVTLGGNVTSDGGETITERGVVYSATTANNNPIIGGMGVTTVTASGTTGLFSVPVSGLSVSTGYSFKAYATNAVGTAYTSVGTFATPVGSLTASFTTAGDVPLTLPAVTLTGGTATLSLGFEPVAGTELMVVKNTGLGFISGTFDNLAQGQTVTLSYGGGDYRFVVNYYGGTGNDLVLVWKNNRVLAWGYNVSGQLGNNLTSDSSLPVAADATGALVGKTVVAVAAGGFHSVALCSDGTVVA